MSGNKNRTPLRVDWARLDDEIHVALLASSLTSALPMELIVPPSIFMTIHC